MARNKIKIKNNEIALEASFSKKSNLKISKDTWICFIFDWTGKTVDENLFCVQERNKNRKIKFYRLRSPAVFVFN